MNIEKIIKELENMTTEERVDNINKIKIQLHKVSPFKTEPVDCVIWVKHGDISANDYNPNTVAPPEMELLKLSILQDGYTQPIVAFKKDNGFEVIDGFHRNRVGKECKEVNTRINGYLPITVINTDREDKSDRIASTIRHNRARGKHGVDSMSDIVVELKNRNWKNERIARELGMDDDEVLRLLQITGISELFKDDDFSRSWDIKDSEISPEELTDDLDPDEKEKNGFRTVNTEDKDRIFHTYDKWECYKAGFYKSSKEDMTREECEEEYKKLLSNEKEFKKALHGVITNWKYSCEHYLSNNAMNRIAWLGQASLCYAKGIPSVFRGGFNLLTDIEQGIANNIAFDYLNKWLVANNRKEVKTLEDAVTDRQSTIY